MPIRILNTIIAFSILGIVSISVRDYIHKSQAKLQETNQPPIITISPQEEYSPTPTVLPKDPKVNCIENSFFPTQVGTMWVYKFNTQITIKGVTKTSNTVLENKLKKIDGPEITIESTIKNDNDIFESILTCRKSGIYGFPFPAAPEDLAEFITSKIKLLGNIGINLPRIQFDQTIRLLPNEEDLKLGSVWNSKFGIDLGLPIDIGALSFDVVNQISAVSNTFVPNYKTVPTFTIQLRPNKKNNQTFPPPVNYQLAQGVGLINLEAELKEETVGSLKSSLKLTKFITPAPTSSSQ